MEKLAYLLWKPGDTDADRWRQWCLTETVPALQAAGARRLRWCVADSAVAAADGYRIVSRPPPFDGLVTFWLDTAGQRAPLEALLQACSETAHGYGVSEAEPLVNRTHRAPAGERTPGMNQVVALQQPERLTRAAWLENWLGRHTAVAIDTQATFGYRQNLVVRPLTAGAPPVDALVEENFPEAALHSREAFYAAEGDPDRKARHEQAMMDSVMRFIDFDKIDCIPMSEYDFAEPENT